MSGDLRALAKAATPGPWEVYKTATSTHVSAVNQHSLATLNAEPDANAAYIAAANPAAILALLDERDALAAKVARGEALADEYARASEPDGSLALVPARGAGLDFRAALKDQP